MKTIISKIKKHLVENGKMELEGKSLSMSGHDEPYMPWHLEWQEWPDGNEVWIAGYDKGDSPDPVLTVTTKDGEIAKMTLQTLVGVIPCDFEYAKQFLELLYSRHCKELENVKS